MKRIAVVVLLLATSACGLGVAQEPDMWDRLCVTLPEYREARAAGDEEAARGHAADVLAALPAELTGEFDRALQTAAQDATEGDFQELDGLAAANNCIE